MEYINDHQLQGSRRSAFNVYSNESEQFRDGSPLTQSEIERETRRGQEGGYELCFGSNPDFPEYEHAMLQVRDLFADYFGEDRVVISSFTDETTNQVRIGVFVRNLTSSCLDK